MFLLWFTPWSEANATDLKCLLLQTTHPSIPLLYLACQPSSASSISMFHKPSVAPITAEAIARHRALIACVAQLRLSLFENITALKTLHYFISFFLFLMNSKYLRSNRENISVSGSKLCLQQTELHFHAKVYRNTLLFKSVTPTSLCNSKLSGWSSRCNIMF